MYGMENSKDLATGSSLHSFMNGQVPRKCEDWKRRSENVLHDLFKRQILAAVQYVNYVSPPADEFGAVALFFFSFFYPLESRLILN